MEFQFNSYKGLRFFFKTLTLRLRRFLEVVIDIIDWLRSEQTPALYDQQNDYDSIFDFDEDLPSLKDYKEWLKFCDQCRDEGIPPPKLMDWYRSYS